MGKYVNVRAKKEQGDKINRLWENEGHSGFLIYTKKEIENEIDYIQKSKSKDFDHLRGRLKTVSDWNNFFPSFKEGNGQIFFNPVYETDTDYKKELKKQILFVLDNRFLFNKITGFEDIRDVFDDIFVKGDYVENGKTMYYPRADFENLPQNPDPVLEICLEADRPDLWKSFCEFRDDPNEKTWENLKHKIVPNFDFVKAKTVWQICEQNEKNITGVDYGLKGKFKDGTVPALFDVYRGILDASKSKNTIYHRMARDFSLPDDFSDWDLMDDDGKTVKDSYFASLDVYVVEGAMPREIYEQYFKFANKEGWEIDEKYSKCIEDSDCGPK